MQLWTTIQLGQLSQLITVCETYNQHPRSAWILSGRLCGRIVYYRNRAITVCRPNSFQNRIRFRDNDLDCPLVWLQIRGGSLKTASATAGYFLFLWHRSPRWRQLQGRIQGWRTQRPRHFLYEIGDVYTRNWTNAQPVGRWLSRPNRERVWVTAGGGVSVLRADPTQCLLSEKKEKAACSSLVDQTAACGEW